MSVAQQAQSGVMLGANAGRVAARKLPVDIGREADVVAERVEGRASQTETVIAGIVIGAALLVGFFVLDSMFNAAGVHTVVDDPANSTLSSDQNDTLDRIGDGLLIGGVIIIVLFAAIILRVLRGL